MSLIYLNQIHGYAQTVDRAESVRKLCLAAQAKDMIGDDGVSLLHRFYQTCCVALIDIASQDHIVAEQAKVSVPVNIPRQRSNSGADQEFFVRDQRLSLASDAEKTSLMATSAPF